MTDDQLRVQLWETVAAGDKEQLAELCQAHREAIFLAYPAWRQAQHEDPKAYGQALAAVAQCFSSHLKDGRLFQLLLGVTDSNPLAAWENELQTARELLGQHDLYDSAQELVQMLERNAQHAGQRADQLRGKTVGLLGEARFLVGMLEESRAHQLQALQLSRSSGDDEAVVTHLINLYELDRYLGDADSARRWVLDLAACDPTRPSAGSASRKRLNSVPPCA